MKTSCVATDEWEPKAPKIRSQWILIKQDPFEIKWAPKLMRRLFKMDSNKLSTSLNRHNPVVSQSSVSIIRMGNSRDSINTFN